MSCQICLHWCAVCSTQQPTGTEQLCATCSMDDFEVCSNGGVESPAQTAQTPSSTSPGSAQAEAEADTSAEQAPSDTEAGTSGHDDSCGTDDDQFSDVGEAPDTEVTLTLLLSISRTNAGCFDYPTTLCVPHTASQTSSTDQSSGLVAICPCIELFLFSH